jgi:hypothetical protein
VNCQLQLVHNMEAVHSFDAIVSNWPRSNLQIRDNSEIKADI